jgi:hypothetical protein
MGVTSYPQPRGADVTADRPHALAAATVEADAQPVIFRLQAPDRPVTRPSFRMLHPRMRHLSLEESKACASDASSPKRNRRAVQRCRAGYQALSKLLPPLAPVGQDVP